MIKIKDLAKGLEDKEVALYSFVQDCYHVEKLTDFLLDNAKHYLKYGKPNQWHLLGIFDKGIQANDFIEEVMKYENNREKLK